MAVVQKAASLYVICEFESLAGRVFALKLFGGKIESVIKGFGSIKRDRPFALILGSPCCVRINLLGFGLVVDVDRIEAVSGHRLSVRSWTDVSRPRDMKYNGENLVCWVVKEGVSPDIQRNFDSTEDWIPHGFTPSPRGRGRGRGGDSRGRGRGKGSGRGVSVGGGGEGKCEEDDDDERIDGVFEVDSGVSLTSRRGSVKTYPRSHDHHGDRHDEPLADSSGGDGVTTKRKMSRGDSSRKVVEDVNREYSPLKKEEEGDVLSKKVLEELGKANISWSNDVDDEGSDEDGYGDDSHSGGSNDKSSSASPVVDSPRVVDQGKVENISACSVNVPALKEGLKRADSLTVSESSTDMGSSSHGSVDELEKNFEMAVARGRNDVIPYLEKDSKLKRDFKVDFIGAAIPGITGESCWRITDVKGKKSRVIGSSFLYVGRAVIKSHGLIKNGSSGEVLAMVRVTQ